MAVTQPGVNNSNQDLVAILDGKTFRPLFDRASVTSVTVRETSKLTTFAVEDGTQRPERRRSAGGGFHQEPADHGLPG